MTLEAAANKALTTGPCCVVLGADSVGSIARPLTCTPPSFLPQSMCSWDTSGTPHCLTPRSPTGTRRQQWMLRPSGGLWCSQRRLLGSSGRLRHGLPQRRCPAQVQAGWQSHQHGANINTYTQRIARRGIVMASQLLFCQKAPHGAAPPNNKTGGAHLWTGCAAAAAMARHADTTACCGRPTLQRGKHTTGVCGIAALAGLCYWRVQRQVGAFLLCNTDRRDGCCCRVGIAVADCGGARVEGPKLTGHTAFVILWISSIPCKGSATQPYNDL